MNRLILYAFLLLSLNSWSQFVPFSGAIDDQVISLVNLCENGTYDGNDSSYWTLGGSTVVANNRLEATNESALNTYTFQSYTLEGGATYQIDLDIGLTSGGVRVRLGGSSPLHTITTSGFHSFQVVAQSSGQYLRFDDNIGGWSGWIDNVVITKI